MVDVLGARVVPALMGTKSLARILEGLTADELAEDGGRRDAGDLFRGEGDDVLEELQQTLRIGIGRRIRADTAQEGLRIVLEHRELENVRGIEHGIGIFLEREDVAVLSAADAAPAQEGIFRFDAAGAVVSDHTAQDTVVRGRDVVVLIEGQGSQRRGVDAENAAVVDG